MGTRDEANGELPYRLKDVDILNTAAEKSQNSGGIVIALRPRETDSISPSTSTIHESRLAQIKLSGGENNEEQKQKSRKRRRWDRWNAIKKAKNMEVAANGPTDAQKDLPKPVSKTIISDNSSCMEDWDREGTIPKTAIDVLTGINSKPLPFNRLNPEEENLYTEEELVAYHECKVPPKIKMEPARRRPGWRAHKTAKDKQGKSEVAVREGVRERSKNKGTDQRGKRFFSIPRQIKGGQSNLKRSASNAHLDASQDMEESLELQGQDDDGGFGHYEDEEVPVKLLLKVSMTNKGIILAARKIMRIIRTGGAGKTRLCSVILDGGRERGVKLN